MSRIKILIGPIILLFMLTSVASSASAGKYEQSGHTYPATLEEKSTAAPAFKFGELSVKCSSAVQTGTLTGATEKVSVVPKYGECVGTEGELKGTSTIKVVNCAYQSTIGSLLGIVKEGTKEAGKEEKEFSEETSIVEAGGACAMTIATKTLTECIVTIGPQSSMATKKDKSKHKWFPFSWEVEKETGASAISYATSKGCVSAKEGAHTGGTLAETTLSGPNFEIN